MSALPTRRRALALLLRVAPLLLPAASGCDRAAAPPEPAAAAPPLVVAAAASLQELLEATAPDFERANPGRTLSFSFGASSTLSRQVEESAAFDAFLSADAANLDRLGPRIEHATRSEFLGNELVVVVRAGLSPRPATPADLARLPGRIALAAPAVPAGKYARAWLARLGQLAALQPKLVEAEHVRAALALVESGVADAAIVYATDARLARRAELAFAAALADDPGIVYVAAAVAGRPAAKLAAAYVRFLRSPEFRAAARAAGFRVPEP
jgi:molybdate transport system substrate-binding protein